MTQIERIIQKYLNEFAVTATPATAQGYTTTLNMFANICGEELPNREHTIQFMQTAKDNGNCANTIRLKMAILRSFEKWALSTKQVAEPFTNDVKLPRPEYRVADRMTYAEASSMIHSDKPKGVSRKNHIRNIAILEMALVTASRVSALCNIRMEDVDLEKKTVRLLHTKNNKELEMPLTDELCATLTDYIENFRPQSENDSGYLFLASEPHSDGTYGKLTRQAVYNIVKTYTKHACGKALSPHKLRHTSASLQLESGLLSIDEISANLGHSSVATTQRYAHRLNDTNRKTATAEIFRGL